MRQDDHVQTARFFLTASDREFEAGDAMQASEKLWGAASQAVIAVAMRRDWNFRSHRSLKYAVGRLAEEFQDDLLRGGFALAEQFHRNFYHNEMEAAEVAANRPEVHRFVNRLLGLLERDRA